MKAVVRDVLSIALIAVDGLASGRLLVPALFDSEPESRKKAKRGRSTTRMSRLTRVIAVVFGALLAYVQLRGILALGFESGEAVVIDAAWAASTALAVLLLLYGLGLYPRRTIVHKI